MTDINLRENITITIDGNDVTDKVISYNRDQQLCTGIGNITIVMVDDSTDYYPWDEILVYEDGEKVGTYYINSPEFSATAGTMTIVAQDASKKLTDYFIDRSYTIDSYSTNIYWIENFLNEVGLNYTFTKIVSTPLSENTALGLSSAYDTIIQLLQYSGLYIYFDANGTAIIGSMRSGTTTTTLGEDRVLSVKATLHDQMLRNRAVVWGNSDPTTGEWIYADLSVNTPWNYDSRDKRAVVLANHNIYSNSAAYSIARLMLNTFSTANNETTVEAEGFFGVHVGNSIKVDADFRKKTGIITTLAVNVSSSGAITTLILDEKCPRLFAYFDEITYTDYVYIGTTGLGVWRKQILGDTWEDFSEGLPSGANITDLYVSNDQFACVASGGMAYHRTEATNWSGFYPEIDDNGDLLSAEDLYAVACTINHLTNNYIIGYNRSGTVGCWVATFSGATTGLSSADQAYTSALGESNGTNFDISIFDLDTSDRENIISVYGIGYIPGVYNSYGRIGDGRSSNNVIHYPDGDTISIGTADGAGGYVPSGSGAYSFAYTLLDSGFVTSDSWHIDGIEYNVSVNLCALNKMIVIWSGSSAEVTASYYESLPDADYASYVGNNLVHLLKVDTSVYKIYGYEYSLDTQTYTTELELSYGTAAASRTKDIFSDGFLALVRPALNYFVLKIVNIEDFSYYEYTTVTDRITDIHNVALTSTKDKIFLITPILRDKNDYSYDWDCDYPGCSDVVTSDSITKLTYELVMEITNFNKNTFNIDTVTYTLETFYATHDLVGPYDFGIPTFFGAGYTRTPVGASLYYDGWNTGFSIGSDLSKVRLIVSYKVDDPNWDYNCYYDEELEECIVATYTSSPYENYVNAIYDVELDSNLVYEVVKIETSTIDYTNLDSYVKYSGFYYANLFTPIASYNRYQCYYIHDSTQVDIATVEYSAPSVYTIDAGIFYHVLDFWAEADYNDGGFFLLINNTLGNTLELWRYENYLFKNKIDFGYTTDGSTDAKCFIFNQTGIIYGRDVSGYDFVLYFDVTNGTIDDPSLNNERPTIAGILNQNNDLFTTILKPYGINMVEISRQYPTELYQLGEQQPMWQTFLNSVDSFSEIDIQYESYDVRTTRFVSISGAAVASGSMDSLDGQYALVATNDALKAFPTSLSGSSVTISNFSGLVNHIESTNYMPDPYLFVSLSGEDSAQFFQRNPGIDFTNFTEYSDTLPSGVNITIIRVDDRL